MPRPHVATVHQRGMQNGNSKHSPLFFTLHLHDLTRPEDLLSPLVLLLLSVTLVLLVLVLVV